MFHCYGVLYCWHAANHSTHSRTRGWVGMGEEGSVGVGVGLRERETERERVARDSRRRRERLNCQAGRERARERERDQSPVQWWPASACDCV